MGIKIRYWLLPALMIAFFYLCGVISSKIYNPVVLLCFLFFLPHYLIFLFSYTTGRKIFSLPRPSRKRAIIAALAAVVLIPLFYFSVLILFFISHNVQPEPFFSLCLNIAILLAWLIDLRMLGLCPPRGKQLFICFVPMLVFAAIGTALILILDTGFWVSLVDSIGPEQHNREIVTNYFIVFGLFIPLVTGSFTMYWTMKYNREQSELAETQNLGAP